jgi:hypothetical protein
MTNYRLYFHDKAGHFARAEDIASASDAEAVSYAGALKHDHDVEVWDHARKVGTAAAPRRGEAAHKLSRRIGALLSLV